MKLSNKELEALTKKIVSILRKENEEYLNTIYTTIDTNEIQIEAEELFNIFQDHSDISSICINSISIYKTDNIEKIFNKLYNIKKTKINLTEKIDISSYSILDELIIENIESKDIDSLITKVCDKFRKSS